VNGVARTIAEWVRPHVPEASDGILTSAGICEGFAGAGVSSGVLIFAGFAGLVAGTFAMGAVEYSKFRAELDQQTGQLERERVQIQTTPTRNSMSSLSCTCPAAFRPASPGRWPSS
jgi:VIT1/CCC1 family predicted Fe2+/Mn2+ transporter